MFTRKTRLVWIGILILSCMYLTGQQAWFDQRPEAEGIIGPEGGTIEVTNPDSPLYGVKVTIPAGALTGEETISIAIPDNVHLLPEGVTLNEPAIEVNRQVTFV